MFNSSLNESKHTQNYIKIIITQVESAWNHIELILQVQ